MQQQKTPNNNVPPLINSSSNSPMITELSNSKLSKHHLLLCGQHVTNSNEYNVCRKLCVHFVTCIFFLKLHVAPYVLLKLLVLHLFPNPTMDGHHTHTTHMHVHTTQTHTTFLQTRKVVMPNMVFMYM